VTDPTPPVENALPVPPRRRRLIALAIAVVGVAVVVLFAVLRPFGARKLAGVESGVASASATALDPAAEEMNAGLRSADANLAAAHFQRALGYVPNHYGASFQLARALDRAGRRDEARPIWERVLRMAEKYDDRQVLEAARARLADPMAAGLEALYTKHDAVTAAARFREVLAQNPEHYGATFQLATALDQADKPAESKPVWVKMLGMAEAIKDTPTADRARARLAEIDKLAGTKADADPDAETMRLGLEALRTKHDPAGAATLFRKVLAHNPEHYGATFQLATALDQANRPAEARPIWTKALKMAEAINDTALAAAARARLTKIP
jgi:tetratricopeptide (TPR) repeat protein